MHIPISRAMIGIKAGNKGNSRTRGGNRVVRAIYEVKRVECNDDSKNKTKINQVERDPQRQRPSLRVAEATVRHESRAVEKREGERS
jgi:hypothetical protein